MALGASNLTFAEATLTQRGPDFIASHMRAFEYFGGVTRGTVIDQLRSGVSKPCRYDPKIQRTYEAMATHYGTTVLPARPKHPRDKAKVEVAVQIAERWILARLRNEVFHTLEALILGLLTLSWPRMRRAKPAAPLGYGCYPPAPPPPMPRTLFELHPVTGYRYIPGLHTQVPHEGGGYLVRTNRVGHRCRHEPTPEKPPGMFRILVFGGGFTAGNGVDEAQRFTELLERQLGGYVQVLNFGLPGSGADQQLLGFRQYGREIEHDLLVLCPHVETILRNLEAHASVPSGQAEVDPDEPSLLPKPRFSLEGAELVLHPPPTEPPAAAVGPASAPGGQSPPTPPSLVRGLLQRFTAEVDKKVPGFTAFTRRVRGVGYPEEYADPQHPAWRLQRAILRTFLAEARTPVVLAPIPTFEHVDGILAADPYLMRFGEVAVEGRCELVNFLPRFFDEPRSVREQCRFAHDPHPTALGHTFLAEGLLPHLRRYL